MNHEQLQRLHHCGLIGDSKSYHGVKAQLDVQLGHFLILALSSAATSASDQYWYVCRGCVHLHPLYIHISFRLSSLPRLLVRGGPALPCLLLSLVVFKICFLFSDTMWCSVSVTSCMLWWWSWRDLRSGYLSVCSSSQCVHSSALSHRSLGSCETDDQKCEKHLCHIWFTDVLMFDADMNWSWSSVCCLVIGWLDEYRCSWSVMERASWQNYKHCVEDLVRVSTLIDFNGFVNNYIKQFIKIHALSV